MHVFILSISLIFFTGYAGLILYYRYGWASLPEIDDVLPPKQPVKISVLVPARNEAQNIMACLDSLVRQSYSKDLYEILVIDDHSTDNTAELVLKYPANNVRLLKLQDFIGAGKLNSYKKKAIEIGVRESVGELIVTTDADCLAPILWLETITGFYEKTHAMFIAMPVQYACRNRPIEIFQALDFMTLQGITGASVHQGTHSMCNGANLAYRKEAFNLVGGFQDIDNIASGDDMLLMHKLAKQFPDGVYFLKSPRVIVTTKAMETLRGFLNQRIRWASKADKYTDKRIFAVLLLVYLFNCWLLAVPFAAIFYQVGVWLLFLLLGKTIIELIFLWPVAAFFKQRSLLWWFPVAQPFHILYTVVAGWLGKFGRYQWKERRVK